MEINGAFGTAGQILKVNSGATALEYANETDTDTVGINLTEDNTGATNYEIMLSGSATASNERDFKTSGINFQPSTNKLTVGNVNLSNKIEIGSSFGTAGQILKVNSGATALEYANETDTIGINLTENTTSSVSFDFLLHNGATATNDRNFNTSSLSYQPSTDKLTVGNINLSNKIEIGGAFGTAGQILKVNSGATALEFANETDTDTIGINLTENTTSSVSFDFVLHNGATATNDRTFNTSSLAYQPSTDKLTVGNVNLSNKIEIGGAFGTAGQILKVNSGATALEYANETDTDTVGINLTEDNTGTTNYEIMLSGTATASNERDFKTSTLNYQPSTSTLTASKVSSDEILLPTANAIKVNGSFGSAGQVLQVNSGATGLEYATLSTGSNLDVVASSSSSAIPILFQTAGTGVSQVLNKSGFTFKPSTSELVAGSMTVNNVSLTTTGQLICNSGVFNIDRSPAADVRIMFKSGGTDKWRIGNQASDDLFNIQNLTLTTTPFSIKADDTIVFNAGLEYTGVQYFKNTNGDVQMSLEQSGAITITETLGVGQVNSAGRDLTVGTDGLEVNGASFLKGTVYLQNVPDFTGSSTCFVPILRPDTGDITSGTFKNDGITFTANTQTLNIKNLNFVASSSKIQLEGADGNNQFLKVNSSGALEFSSGSGGGVNVADDTTSGERPVVFSNAATPASTLGINSNLTYQPNSGAFKFKGDNVFSVGVGGEAAQQGAQIQFDSRYGEAGPNKISLFQTGGGGYGFGVDASTLKHLSPADHVFFTGSANDSNGNEALVINDDDEFIFAPSSTARVLGTTGSAKAFFEGRVVVGGPGNAGIWFKDDSDPSTVITSGNPFIGLNGDGNWRVYINGNKLNINQNGTQTHTIGSNYARFQQSSTEFTQIRRYGIETQRSTAYFRPANTGNGTLYIGNIFTNGRKYNNIRYAATSTSGAHRFYMGGTDGGAASGQRVVLGYGTGNVNNGFGFTTPNFRIACNGTCSATSFNTTSDARVKTNIVDYADDKCLEVIKSIPIKKYDYTDDYRTEDGEERQQVVGFLADDLVDNPELRGVVDKRDMYEEEGEETPIYDEEGEVADTTPAERVIKYKDLMSVDKPRLVAFTIGAIKSLDATIQQQQSTITQLQEEIAIIKSHLNI